MTHLEQLTYEFYDWQGYLVKHNIHVGKRKTGGWEMELDIVAYHPITKHLIHIEPSLDADSWVKREKRFRKKFTAGKKYIQKQIFPWLGSKVKLEQQAILVSHSKDKKKVGGGTILSVDEFMAQIQDKILESGKMSQNAIPQQYPLLRTVQMVTNGYNRLHKKN